MGYLSALCVGPIGTALVAAAGVYYVLRCRREEVPVEEATEPLFQPAEDNSGRGGTTDPPPSVGGAFQLSCGAVRDVLRRWFGGTATPQSVEEGAPEAAPAAPTARSAVDSDGKSGSQPFSVGRGAAEEENSSSEVTGVYQRGNDLLRETFSMVAEKSAEWMPDSDGRERIRRFLWDVSFIASDAIVGTRLRGLSVPLKLYEAGKRATKESVSPAKAAKKKSPSDPSGGGGSGGKEVKELRSEMDQVKVHIEEIRLQNKEILGHLSRHTVGDDAMNPHATYEAMIDHAPSDPIQSGVKMF